MQINPIIEKELKTKMRGWRAPALITVYLGFLLLVITIYFIYNNQMTRFGMGSFNPRVALNAYNTLALFQLLLLLFITPAMTGGAISSERERQTLDLLLCTDFSAFKIISGKMVVSIVHVLLLITASLPLMSIVFLFGGVGITDILLLFFFYISTAVMLGSIGTFYSTIFKKTIVSIVITYITVLVITIGTFVLMAVFYLLTRVTGTPSFSEVAGFLFANPIFGFGSIIDGTAGNSSFFSGLAEMAKSGLTKDIFIKSWMINVLFDFTIAAVLLYLSTVRIRQLK